MRFNRPCLKCGTLTKGSLCPTHEAERKAFIEADPARREKKKTLYTSAYKKQAAWIRKTYTHCNICGLPATSTDPIEADHVIPGDTSSPLQPAHRSCNIKKSNKA